MAYWGKYLISLLSLSLCLFASATVWAKSDGSSLHHAQAEYYMGSRYYFGIDISKDVDQALVWYKKSAQKGHAKSELAVAQTLMNADLKNRRFQEALPWVIKAAGPHNTPQISGKMKAETDAKKILRSMCKKGLVDFPKDHPYASDPKCWLERGDRLYHGQNIIDYHLKKNKKKYYGVKKDIVAARLYLEKAFAAGEIEAAGHLATIYGKGQGVPKDLEKFKYFTEFAAKDGQGKPNYYLAEQALESGDPAAHIEYLKISAKAGYTRALRGLAWAYFKGEYVENDTETAFMYFFLADQHEFVRSRDARHGDLRLPFFKNTFLPTFQDEDTLKILEASLSKANDFAKENKFREYQTKKIKWTFNRAVSDFHYVQETGGEWHKSGIWDRLWMYFMIFVVLLIVRSAVGYFARR